MNKEHSARLARTPVHSRPLAELLADLATTETGLGREEAARRLKEVGPNTELGRINTLITEVERLETPLTRQMRRFGTVLSIAILGLALAMVAVGRVVHGFSLSELFLAAIGFAVAAIPEGLPAILTITLALGVQRMARRNAITRKLNAVETLGSVTVICSGKTGTLTRNEMTACHVVTRAGRFDVDGTGYAPEGGSRPGSGTGRRKREEGSRMQPVRLVFVVIALVLLVMAVDPVRPGYTAEARLDVCALVSAEQLAALSRKPLYSTPQDNGCYWSREPGAMAYLHIGVHDSAQPLRGYFNAELAPTTRLELIIDLGDEGLMSVVEGELGVVVVRKGGRVLQSAATFLDIEPGSARQRVLWEIYRRVVERM